MSVEFKCPECKGDRLEEIMADVTVASVIISIGEGGDIQYGEQSNEGGHVERYQCMDCGHVIPGIENSEQLFEFLSTGKNPWVSE
jgi:predicted RNA-binding Zn-ribbon protein involved in translation (DUF1610 family)